MAVPESERRAHLNQLANKLQLDAHDIGINIRIDGGHSYPARIEMHADQSFQSIDTQRLFDLEEKLKEEYGPKTYVDLENDLIVIPRTDRGPVQLSTLVKRLPISELPIGTTPLGLADCDGLPVLVNLPRSYTPHFLIAGHDKNTTSAFLRTTVRGFEALNHPRHMQIAPYDFDAQRALDPLQDHNGQRYLRHNVISDPTDAEHALSQLVDLQQIRSQSGEQYPQIAIAMNEPTNLFTQSLYSKMLVDELLANGSRSGIHIIAATSRPGLDPRQFPMILLSQTATAKEANELSLADHTKAEDLPFDAFVSVSHLGHHIFYPVHDS